MGRLFVLLLVAAPAWASEVFVHLDLSESMRAAMQRGAVQALRVELATQIVETREPTAIVSDVEAGTWRLRAFIVTRDATYIVHPRGQEIVVTANTRADVLVAVPALFVAGRATLHGKPFAGSMLVSPSKPKSASWSVNVPVDAHGRFAFPLPWPGECDVRLYSRNTMVAMVPGVAITTTNVDVAAP